MYSLVDIANLALSFVPTSSTIANINERSDECDAFNRFYPIARDMTLTGADWGFARRYGALSDLGSPRPDWLYRYALPVNCLKVRSIIAPGTYSTGATGPVADASAPTHWQDGLPARGVRANIPFEIAADVDAQSHEIKVLYTNQDSAIIRYTLVLTGTSLFTPEFVMALARYMAHLMGPQLGATETTITNNFRLWQLALEEASAEDANEGGQIQNVQPDWGWAGNR